MQLVVPADEGFLSLNQWQPFSKNGADHVFREADRFLEIIDMFDAHLISNNPQLRNEF